MPGSQQDQRAAKERHRNRPEDLRAAVQGSHLAEAEEGNRLVAGEVHHNRLAVGEVRRSHLAAAEGADHIQEARHHIAVAVIRMVVGSVHIEVGIDHKEVARPSCKEAGFVHRVQIDSDQKAQEIVEGILESDRIGFGHTAAAALGEVEEEVCCSLERVAGRMVAEMIEDIAETGREAAEVGHREQEKNSRQCSDILVREVATGRASWQKVVAVEAGERRSPSPRRQDMLGSPTLFQRRWRT